MQIHKMLLCALLIGCFTAGTAQELPEKTDDAEPDQLDKDILQVFMPGPRDLRQKISRAERAIAEQDYSYAVGELAQVFSAPEDFFINPHEPQPKSMKQSAHRLLGSMPPRGREFYQIQFGPDAQAMLEEALAAGDIGKLAEVPRTYFHTEAGYEATILLGRYHLDRGRPLAGAMCLKRIVDTPGAGKDHEPHLSILLATCWLYADMPEKAQRTLAGLKRRLPRAFISVGGQDVKLFDRPEEALSWMQKIVGSPTFGSSLAATQWTMFRGNETRNAESSGGIPIANPRWRVPVLNDPSDEQLANQLRKQYLDQRLPALPAMHSLAVDDWVLLRTPKGLLGVEFKTGKRVWEYPWGKQYSLTSQSSSTQAMSGAARRNELNQRLWEDAAYGQMSSDGKSIYLIDEMGYALKNGMSGRVIMAPNGIRRDNPNYPRDYNVLTAIALRDEKGSPVEGKIRWKVGGAAGWEEPELAGAFFLGPPLTLLGQLYVLVEMNGQIELKVLDAKTGQLQWSQQLAHLEANPILKDVPRRLAGASPSFADGVIVCPTSSSAVVAVDLSTRSLLWGYQYKHTSVIRDSRGFASRFSHQVKPIGDRWADATVTLADGRAILTPVESDEMHCLDLLSGELLWKRKRDDLLFVAAVHGRNVMLVGKTKVVACDLNSGEELWNTGLGRTALPSGRGFLSDGYYYLPTTDAEVVQVDAVDGKIVKRAKTDTVLGNLVCYKGEVISQGVDWLTTFHQVEPLRERVEQALQANPDDAWALARKGELLMQDGNEVAALAAIRQAYEQDRTKDATRALLVKSLLHALREDFAGNQHTATEIEGLIDHPEQRSEYLRLRAVGLQQIGRADEAFDAFLALSERAGTDNADPSQPLFEQIDRNLRVRQAHWIQARLNTLLAEGDEDARARMDAIIGQRYQAAVDADSMHALREFIDYFGSHPMADWARLQLAANLVKSNEVLEAELLFSRLHKTADVPTAGQATARLAILLEKANRPTEAADYFRLLRTKWAAAVCYDGKTGKLLHDEAQARLDTLKPSAEWAAGRAEIKPGGDTIISRPSYQRVYPIAIEQNDGATQQRLKVAWDQRLNSVEVRNSVGDVLCKVSLNRDGRRNFYTSNYAVTRCRLRGHLLLLSVGYELIAVDMLRATQNANEAILWRDELPSPLAAQPTRYVSRRSVQSKSITNPWGFTKYVAVDEHGRRVGATSMLTDRGVCYLKQGELVCVEPLTGELIWSHGGCEPGSDLLGDEEHVFVLSPDGAEARVFDMIDGAHIATKNLQDHTNRWAALGRRVLSWKKTGEELHVSLYDVSTEANVWSGKFAGGSKGCLIEHDEVGILQPDGKFVVVSLRNGDVKLDTKVEKETALQSIHVLRSADQYILAANSVGRFDSKMNIQAAPSGFQSPLIHGRLYAFDRGTGKSQWQVPAFISQYGLPLDQPCDLPVLTFLRHLTPTVQRGPRRTHTSILCIDKRDGRVLVAQDDIPAHTYSYEIVGKPAEQKVAVMVPGRRFTITFTDQSQPPAPPAQTGDASSLHVSKTGKGNEDLIEAFSNLPANGIFDPEVQKRLQDEDLKKAVEEAARRLVPKQIPGLVPKQIPE